MKKSIGHFCASICILALTCTGTAQAVIFDLTYDDTPTGAIDGNIIGTGTFSYDGPAVAGSFLLSNLTGISFSATFTGGASFSGPPFDPANLALIGIDVADVGGGVFELIFTGNSAGTTGSLDILTGTGILSHEPGPLLGGGTGPNLYFANDGPTGLDAFADYLARSRSNVPEPSVALMLSLGVAGLGWMRRRAK
jgi:hypothetical protein